MLLCLAGAAAGLTFLHVGSALAYWMSTDSSHPATAAAATLSAPAGGAQNGTATPAAIPIKWTAPSGYTPTGYTVLRCTGSSCTNFTAIGNGTCSGTISGTSCTDTDTGLSAGTTYSYEVKAQLDDWVSAASTAFQAATTAPAKLAFTTQPLSNASIQATGTGNFGVSVVIEDANGAIAANDNSDTVTLAIASGHNPGSGTLTCTGGLTATAASGVASFTGCAITKAGSGYQLTASSATSSSLTAPANANSFNIVAGTFAQYAVRLAASATAGTPVSVTLTEQDVNGNTETSNSGNQTITWSGPQNSPNGAHPTLPGGTVSFSSGVSTTALNVTFTDAGSQTLTATDGSSRTGSATTTVNGAGPATIAMANCLLRGATQACNGPFPLSVGGKGGTFVADVQAFDLYGNPGTISSTVTMSVVSSDTANYSITGTPLTINGTANPPNQSTGTFTLTKTSNGTFNSTITIHVTSGQSIPDITFTVK